LRDFSPSCILPALSRYQTCTKLVLSRWSERVWHNLRCPLFCRSAQSRVRRCSRPWPWYTLAQPAQCLDRSIASTTVTCSRPALQIYRSTRSGCESFFSLHLQRFRQEGCGHRGFNLVFGHFCDSTMRGRSSGWQKQKFPCARPCCSRACCKFLLRPACS